MYLRKGRNKIIKLFEDKYIKPTGFPYNVKPEQEPKSEPKYELEYEYECEPEFEETITERRLQELVTTDMPHLESEEFAEQRRKKKGQGLKILTPNKMLGRLPIS